MAVPTQGTLHRHVLGIVAESKEPLSIKRIVERLVVKLSLTDVDMQVKTPSGALKVKTNTAWAAKYLYNAGLVRRPERGLYEVTEQGMTYCKNHDGELSTTDLLQMAALKDSSEVQSDKTPTISAVDAIPDQIIADGYAAYRDSLVEDLLESLLDLSPDRFEELTVKLLQEMGYGRGDVVGRSGDGGIDGIINQDALGLEKVYIQAKRWSAQVGEPEIRNFSGSLDPLGANKGVFMTTSSFSSTAKQTAQTISAGNKTIRLVDGKELASLMIDHGIGVVTKIKYEIKELDGNYFGET